MTAENRVRVESWIASSRVIPILRLRNHLRVLDVAKALFDSGLDLMEVTLDHPQAVESLAKLANALRTSVLLGAGTVRVVEQVAIAKEAGAQFLVSPGLDREVVAAAREQGMLLLPGVLTPTELERAQELGVDLVKLFPAGAFGPSYLSALRGPYATARFVPTGGITLPTARSWLNAGATAIGVGSELVGGHLSIAEIGERARRLVNDTRKG